MVEYETEDEIAAAIRGGTYESRKQKPSRDTKATLFAMIFSFIFWDAFCLAIASSFPKDDYSPAVYKIVGYGCFFLPAVIPLVIILPRISAGERGAISFFRWFLFIELAAMASLWLLLLIPGTWRPPIATCFVSYVLEPGALLAFATICYFCSDTLRMRSPRPMPLSDLPPK